MRGYYFIWYTIGFNYFRKNVAVNAVEALFDMNKINVERCFPFYWLFNYISKCKDFVHTTSLGDFPFQFCSFLNGFPSVLREPFLIELFFCIQLSFLPTIMQRITSCYFVKYSRPKAKICLRWIMVVPRIFWYELWIKCDLSNIHVTYQNSLGENSW